MYNYQYPRPAVTVDAIVFAKDEEKILLIQRKNDPFQGTWAFPGGFVDENEDLHTAALRELLEETQVSINSLTQFYTSGTPGRDPRGHTISVIYYAIIDRVCEAKAQDDAMNLQWFPIHQLPKLAFDHDEILLNFINNILKK